MKTYKQLHLLYLSKLNQLYDDAEISALLKEVVANFNGSYSNTLSLIDENSEIKILKVLDELESGKPLQHILGKAYFYNLEFKVNEHTLIPRPETEELVHLIIQNHKNQSVKILDIGTGTGCIPITLKKNLVQADVSSLDISLEALEIAKENALYHQTEITFYHDDALNLDSNKYPKHNIIVSNPPYVKQNEKAEMHQNVLDFEPHLALFVEDNNPLIFYNRIGDFALNNLNTNGKLYFEINQYLANETKELLERKGFNTELFKDINNNYRMLKAWL